MKIDLLNKWYSFVMLLLIALSLSFPAIAQEKGDVAIGINGLGGIYVDNTFSFGFGLKLLYNITAPLLLTGEMDFSTGVNLDNNIAARGFQDYSLYVHYLLPVSKKVAVYPLVGGGVLRTKSKTDFSGIAEKAIDYRFVSSLGAGFDYAITNNLTSSVELRFKHRHHGRNHYIYLASIAYKF